MKNNKDRILLIWDIDGTLLLGKGNSCEAMNIAFQQLFDISNAFNGYNFSGRTDGFIVDTIFDKFSIEKTKKAEFLDAYCEILEHLERKNKNNTSQPNIQKLLDIVTNLPNFHNILGTGNIERAAFIKLSTHGLDHYFKTGAFSKNEHTRAAVMVKGIAKYEQRTGIQFLNHNKYIIGDTPLDIDCGKTLQIKTIAVATGIYSFDELSKTKPTHLLTDFIEVDEFLNLFDKKNLCKKTT